MISTIDTCFSAISIAAPTRALCPVHVRYLPLFGVASLLFSNTQASLNIFSIAGAVRGVVVILALLLRCIGGNSTASGCSRSPETSSQSFSTAVVRRESTLSSPAAVVIVFVCEICSVTVSPVWSRSPTRIREISDIRISVLYATKRKARLRRSTSRSDLDNRTSSSFRSSHRSGIAWPVRSPFSVAASRRMRRIARETLLSSESGGRPQCESSMFSMA